MNQINFQVIFKRRRLIKPRNKATLFYIFLVISNLILPIFFSASVHAGFLIKFGQFHSTTNGELYLSPGITADNNGYVYVCSTDGYITKFDSNAPVTDQDGDGDIDVIDKSKSKFVTRWSSACEGLEADGNGNLYVATGYGKVFVYDSAGTVIRQIGQPGSDDGELYGVRDVSIYDALAPCDLCNNGKCPPEYVSECPNGKMGVVYVLDTKNFRVSVFDIDGNFLFKWGSQGTGDGQFSGPRGPFGIAVDETQGWVYVADTEAHKIQKFDRDGNFLLKWGGAGSNVQGGIKFPRDVEVDSNGYVYESDTDAERIQVFDSNGNFIMEFQGLQNENDGPFHPRSVAVDSNGYIYAAAAYANRVDKFSPIDPLNPTANFTWINGQPGHRADERTGVEGEGSKNYLDSWGWLEKGSGIFRYPGGIAIDTINNYIYIADTANTLIQKFDTNGNFIKEWGCSGRIWTPYYNGLDGHPCFDFPENITTDEYGNVYQLQTGSDYGGDPQIKRVQKFDQNGNLLENWHYTNFTENMRSITYNSYNDRIYISNTPLNRIQYFSTDGTYIGEFPFTNPARTAVDGSNGDIYAVDVNNNQIYKFDQNGSFILKWGQYGTGDGQFRFRGNSGIYVDNYGYVYVADTNNSRIQIFDSNGNFILKFGQSGYEDGNFYAPIGVVVDSSGYIYVLDYSKNNVQKFSPVIGNGTAPPTAVPNGPYSGIEGQTITLTGAGSSDPDGNIVLYEWDINNDGIYDYSSSLPTQNHAYAQQGTYTIRLRVTDNAGAKDDAATTAIISDTSPSADFSGIPTTGTEQLTVNFTNNSTGYDQPLTYQWDFDDNGTIDSTVENPSYTYTDSGTYAVKLTVNDADGSTNVLTKTNYITVTPRDYVLTINISGSGTVTSSPAGINCPGDCTEPYPGGSDITLTAIPQSGYKAVWTGCDSASGNQCTVTMNADTNVTVAFEVCSNPTVRILGVTFDSLQAAYDAAQDGDIIQGQGVVFTEDLVLNRNISVTLTGGYDCDFIEPPLGQTILNGSITVSNGKITAENLIIQQ